MVNHYATLLMNLPGVKNGGTPSYFIDRNYSPVTLPKALQDFYNIIFPPATTAYQKQFLCYSYLRLIHSTGLVDLLTSFDNRITYDLDKLTEYFRTYQISPPVSNNPNYSLLVTGKYKNNKNNYYYNSYTVSQLGSTNTISVFSNIDKLFLNGNQFGQTLTGDLTIPLTISQNSPTSSTSMQIGGSNLSFIITGPLNNFNLSSNKQWTFIAEAPLRFSFQDTLKALELANSKVDNMINYGLDTDEKTNENIWNLHFNSVYRFAGLLNCYITRVNKLIK